MFDILSVKQDVILHYFKVFNDHQKPLVKKFINDWIYFLEIYSKIPNFIRFDKEIPVLTHLSPNIKTLIIVQFQNEDEKFSNTSVFPICLFTAYLKNRNIVCKESLNILLLYLEIANIKYIAFYKVTNYKKIMSKIYEYNSTIKCYPPSSFYFFCKRHKIYKY